PEHWDCRAADADFFDVKADVRALLKPTNTLDAFRFEAVPHPALHPGKSARIVRGGEEGGWLGVIHPVLQRDLELRRSVLLFALRLDVIGRADVPAYRPYSKFPTVRRDLALVVDEGVDARALIEHARAAAGEQL